MQGREDVFIITQMYMLGSELHPILAFVFKVNALSADFLRAGHYELNLGLPVHAAIAARLRDDAQGSPDGFSWINLMHDMAS
jgi:hypothetical protein